MIQSAREGNSGILYLRSEGEAETVFVPNYDMDAAIELLREFQELKQSDARPLRASYKIGRYNWYPAMVSYLFWYIFFPYIKYQPLVAEYLSGDREFFWNNHGAFRSFIDGLKRQSNPTLKTRIHYWLIKWNNRWVARRTPVDLLYFSFGRNDFRGKEIRETLIQLGSNLIEVVPRTNFLNMIRNMLGKGRDYYYGREPTGNGFRYIYDLTNLLPEKALRSSDSGGGKIDHKLPDRIRGSSESARKMRRPHFLRAR